MENPLIYHLTTLQEWELAQDKGHYESKTFDQDGFIHCSYAHQLETVLKKYFKHHENLVKLVIDPNRVLHPIKVELNAAKDDDYPHIYGPLNLEAVVQLVFLDPITSEN